MTTERTGPSALQVLCAVVLAIGGLAVVTVVLLLSIAANREVGKGNRTVNCHVLHTLHETDQLCPGDPDD